MPAVHTSKIGKSRADKSTFQLLYPDMEKAYTARECLILAGFGEPGEITVNSHNVISQPITLHSGKRLANLLAPIGTHTLDRSQESKRKRKQRAEYMRKNRAAGRWNYNE
jgi:hypothetical protein